MLHRRPHIQIFPRLRIISSLNITLHLSSIPLYFDLSNDEEGAAGIAVGGAAREPGVDEGAGEHFDGEGEVGVECWMNGRERDAGGEGKGGEVRGEGGGGGGRGGWCLG